MIHYSEDFTKFIILIGKLQSSEGSQIHSRRTGGGLKWQKLARSLLSSREVDFFLDILSTKLLSQSDFLGTMSQMDNRTK